jgi:PAS domain S-box-containing protein
MMHGTPTTFIAPWETDVMRRVGESLARGEPCQIPEMDAVAKDGTVRAISATIFPVRDEQGNVTGAATIAHDVTDRKRAQAALKESEARYREVVESSPDAILVSVEGVVLYANPAAATLLEAGRADDLWGQALDRFFGGDLSAGERELLTIAGHRLPVDVITTGITYDGRVARRTVIRDLSERRRAQATERRLQEERDALLARMQLQFERMPIAGMLIDNERRVVDWNPAATEIFGFTRQEAVGEVVDFMIPPAIRAEVAELLSRMRMEDSVARGIYENVTKDGRTIKCEWHGAPLYDSDGAAIGIFSMAMDVTEREAAAERIRAFAEQLERSNRELQEFAAVASHDLQEPLRKIRAFGDRLRMTAASALDEGGQEYLARMLDAAERMQRLINDLLELSRVTTRAQPFVATDLAAVAREALKDLELAIEQSGAEVAIDDLPTIDADPAQMRRLFLNLLSNALKFRKPNVASRLAIRGRVDGGSVQLEIADNGIGFDEKYLDRVFNPFQRLHGRDDYEGTGIGLTICRRIVERHGGQITAKSKPKQGSTFIVDLPTRQQTGAK